ncbi:MAG: hypothetical protein ACYC6G_12360 [Desulfobaccales bacterium]
MSFARIKGELTSRIGRPVRFGAPKDVKAKGGEAGYGVIVDEVWADPELNLSPYREADHLGDWGDYSFCAQLIKWPQEEEFSIRLAYYRRRAGEDYWTYASQMTVNSDWKTIKKLLERTLKKQEWFQDKPIFPGNDE